MLHLFPDISSWKVKQQTSEDVAREEPSDLQ